MSFSRTFGSFSAACLAISASVLLTNTPFTMSAIPTNKGITPTTQRRPRISATSGGIFPLRMSPCMNTFRKMPSAMPMLPVTHTAFDFVVTSDLRG